MLIQLKTASRKSDFRDSLDTAPDFATTHHVPPTFGYYIHRQDKCLGCPEVQRWLPSRFLIGDEILAMMGNSGASALRRCGQQLHSLAAVPEDGCRPSKRLVVRGGYWSGHGRLAEEDGDGLYACFFHGQGNSCPIFCRLQIQELTGCCHVNRLADLDTMSKNFPNTLKPAEAQLQTNPRPPPRATISQLRRPKIYTVPSDFFRMDQNFATPEGFIWPDMPYDISTTIDIHGVGMDGVNLVYATLPTQDSLDPSPFLFPVLESVNIRPFEEILAQTRLGYFTDMLLINNTPELGSSNPLGAALVEPFTIPGPWTSAGSPISTVSYTSLATSPLEQISPWTTPGPLQASSPVAPIEGHYLFCPPPVIYLNGPDLAPCWPPGQVDEITATPLPLPSSLSFSPYSDGLDQAWMNEQLPTLGPLASDMSLTGTSTALTTFSPPPVPFPAKNTIVGGKQSRQRLTKAGRITK